VGTDAHRMMVHTNGTLVMGLVYGIIYVIGPDHLGTLMTLSSVTNPTRAFRVGAAWGLGHSIGMVFVAAMFLLMRGLIEINVNRWEHYGNYPICAAMMACALYFIWFKSSFLKGQADGSIVPQACACHGSAIAEPPEAPEADPLCYCCEEGYGTTSQVGRRRLSFGKGPPMSCPPCRGGDATPSKATEGQVAKGQPFSAEQVDLRISRSARGGLSLAERPWWQRIRVERGAKGAVLGIFQGLCCPLGMLGVSFLANLPAAGIAGSLLVFMCMSAFGTAFLAMAWAWLTAYGLGTKISPRVIYRVSCGLMLALGVACVICNYFGVLGKLDYTEGVESS